MKPSQGQQPQTNSKRKFGQITDPNESRLSIQFKQANGPLKKKKL